MNLSQIETADQVTVARTIFSAPGQGRELRVYAINFADGLVKVGISSNVRARIMSVASSRRVVGHSHKYDGIAFTVQCLNAREIEKYLLSYFARAHGEFVYASFDEVVRVMRSLSCRTEMTEKEIEAEKARDEFFKTMCNALRPTVEQPKIPQSYDLMQQLIDTFQVIAYQIISEGLPEEDALEAFDIVRASMDDWVFADDFRPSPLEMIASVGKSMGQRRQEKCSDRASDMDGSDVEYKVLDVLAPDGCRKEFKHARISHLGAEKLAKIIPHSGVNQGAIQ